MSMRSAATACTRKQTYLNLNNRLAIGIATLICAQEGAVRFLRRCMFN